MSRVAGFTSTGSKRPEALFGAPEPALRMRRSEGCRVWDTEGREYLDFVMALGAVALGYGHPAVTRAAVEAIESGGVGSLAPVAEEELAAEMCRRVPWIERVRFLKTGAEAMSAAVRLARAATGRERVIGCGYHGWHDWCQIGDAPGVPAGTRALYEDIPFNDPGRARERMRAAGDHLAAVVFEPVILGPPNSEWLEVLREETTRIGALLVVDEIKTAGRLAPGGGCERFSIRPDLVVLGKAIANGYPLAAVGGRADVMEIVRRTWVSSTLATEWVSLAASLATLRVLHEAHVPEHLTAVGGRLMSGLELAASRHERLVTRAVGLPEMCHLEFREESRAGAVARACARRGLLFKRGAYNFVSLAHDNMVVDRGLGLLEEALDEVGRTL